MFTVVTGCGPAHIDRGEIEMTIGMTEEHSAEPAPAVEIETWTPERTAELVRLWAEGVTTAEIGRRLCVSKNAVIGKVHRVGLTPRNNSSKRFSPPPRRNIFDFAGTACLWPIGHPNDDHFHFCGAQPAAGKPYCEHHAALAYIRPKDKAEAA